MKLTSIFAAVFGMAFIGNALAADITVYYSPTCPHCHHAREFISNNLIYEYPNLKVTQIDVTQEANQQVFGDALKKCEYATGGVPVLVVGEKCFQGYGDSVADPLREAVEADLSDEDKAVAAENKKAMAEDAEKFKSEHADRVNAITEYGAENVNSEEIATENTAAEQESASTEKKNNGGVIYFYGFLVLLVVALGVLLIKKDKKKN